MSFDKKNEKARRQIQSLNFVSGFLLFFSGLLIVLGVLSYQGAQRLKEKGLVAEATVVAKRSHAAGSRRGHSRREYHLMSQFYDKDGRIRVESVDCARLVYENTREGDTIKILYDPQNPAYNRYGTTIREEDLNFQALPIVMGGVFLLPFWAMRKEIQRLRKNLKDEPGLG